MSKVFYPVNRRIDLSDSVYRFDCPYCDAKANDSCVQKSRRRRGSLYWKTRSRPHKQRLALTPEHIEKEAEKQRLKEEKSWDAGTKGEQLKEGLQGWLMS
jgi:hypothetical protein